MIQKVAKTIERSPPTTAPPHSLAEFDVIVQPFFMIRVSSPAYTAPPREALFEIIAQFAAVIDDVPAAYMPPPR
jgi:hypothetical protein